MEIDALRANLDENHARLLARSCAGRYWATAVLLRHTVVAVALFCCGSCKQSLVVGEYNCPISGTDGGGSPNKTNPIFLPWSTGFENQLDCDYRAVAGFCYGYPPVVFRVVSSPVHTGQFAAEFSVVTGTDAGNSPQARCVREGVFPPQAYYGAWYYLPTSATNTGLWNLFHFQGGDDLHGLWDVSLVNGTTGALNLRVFGFLGKSPVADATLPIPIGSWVHIEFYWKRAKDNSGEVALYQDGARVAGLTNIVTDDTGSGQGQWYVGSLANALQPPEFTVYVDDVTISANP